MAKGFPDNGGEQRARPTLVRERLQVLDRTARLTSGAAHLDGDGPGRRCSRDGGPDGPSGAERAQAHTVPSPDDVIEAPFITTYLKHGHQGSSAEPNLRARIAITGGDDPVQRARTEFQVGSEVPS